jgi:hypothetical protein
MGANTGGSGGTGLASNIADSSTNVFYAGGGGGYAGGVSESQGVTGGTGGSGVGGNGARGPTGGTPSAATPGSVNKGGGGGGDGDYGTSEYLGAGGSGVVILSYPSTDLDFTSIGAGLTYTKTVSGGKKIYKFTAGTGTVTV